MQSSGMLSLFFKKLETLVALRLTFSAHFLVARHSAALRFLPLLTPPPLIF